MQIANHRDITICKEYTKCLHVICRAFQREVPSPLRLTENCSHRSRLDRLRDGTTGMVGTTNHPRRPTTTPLPSKQLTLMQALKRLPSVGQFVNLHLTEMSIKVKPGVIQYDFKRRTLPPGPPFSSVAPLRPAGTASRPRRDNPALT